MNSKAADDPQGELSNSFPDLVAAAGGHFIYLVTCDAARKFAVLLTHDIPSRLASCGWQDMTAMVLSPQLV